MTSDNWPVEPRDTLAFAFGYLEGMVRLFLDEHITSDRLAEALVEAKSHVDAAMSGAGHSVDQD